MDKTILDVEKPFLPAMAPPPPMPSVAFPSPLAVNA